MSLDDQVKLIAKDAVREVLNEELLPYLEQRFTSLDNAASALPPYLDQRFTSLDKLGNAIALALASMATPTPTPTPTPDPTPAVQYLNIPMGANGHEGRSTYPASEMEARIKLLAANNLRHYRTDVGTGYLDNTSEMNRLIGLCVANGVTLRPMIYPCTEAQAYAYAKAYGDRVKVWEIGNEVDLKGPTNAPAIVDTMVATYKGMKRASDELGLGLKFTLNVTATNTRDKNNAAYGDANGATWFLDLCRSKGFLFDYISFHYYPRAYDSKSDWFDFYLTQVVAYAKRTGAKVFVNEFNCGEIYDGKTGTEQECVDSLRASLGVLNAKYKDVVREITLYELLDEPNQGGVEAHFGLRTNLATPKATWNVVTEFALAQVTTTPAAELPVVGVNMGMLSNNPQVYPGVEGQAYHKWDRANVKARADKGCRLMRMPIAWARLQQFQGQPITTNQKYLDEIVESLDIAKEFGIRVVVDCHAFFRPWGGKVVTDTNALVDFWSKLDGVIGKHPAVWAYDLMNEPYSMDDALVFSMIQAAVTAVNKINPNVVLMIPGRDYSDAETWPKRSDDLKNIQGKNLMFTAHKYIFNGGNYRSSAEATATVDPDAYINLVLPFVNWCKANGVRGYLGEVGVPYNGPTSIVALDRLLAKCIEWRMPVTYWADGNGWPDADYLSLTSGGDTYIPANDRRTLLDVLEKHFPARVSAYGPA